MSEINRANTDLMQHLTAVMLIALPCSTVQKKKNKYSKFLMQLGHHLTMVISSSDKNLTKNVVKENGELSFPIYRGVQFSRNL